VHEVAVSLQLSIECMLICDTRQAIGRQDHQERATVTPRNPVLAD